jgi:prepilin-type N-terminal cleavage/methylation domain-containing protein
MVSAKTPALGMSVAPLTDEQPPRDRPEGQSTQPEELDQMMRNAKGFTLIELLIVVVIIGILAAIAIPKFASTKEKAYIASMKSDLKNFVTAEEAYFSDNNQYGDQAAVQGANLFTPTTNVTVTVTGGAGTATGWIATATHPGTGQVCTVAVGDQVAAPVTTDGEVVCQ